jgi:MFS family permease
MSRRALAMLGLLALTQLLGMGGWFAGGALAGELGARWALSPSEAAWLTSAVQVGFVAGTLLAALLNLPDLVPGRWYVAANATLAALANAALLVFPTYPAAIGSRFLVGVFLAGVYPPAMKMAATWFRDGRGFAIGTVVGALTVGKATPWLVEAAGGLGLRAVVGSTALAALAAGLLVAVAYRDGPYAFPRRPFSWRLVGEVARVREMRLVTAGYLGHMWELYAFWAYVAAFWSASLTARGAPASEQTVSALAFVSIGIGVVGCIWGGLAADRAGRERVVLASLAASGACALLSAAVFGQPLLVVLPVILVWGMAVIADSAQFSALVTEVAPAHGIGTALTLQTSLGFLLTMAAIQLMPLLVDAWGTRWAFPVLAAGPALGMVAIRRLGAVRAVRAAG